MLSSDPSVKDKTSAGHLVPPRVEVQTELAMGYIDNLVGQLTERSKQLARLNAGIVILTAVIIAVCIFIFWQSDSIVEHLGKLDAIRKDNDNKRKDLINERDALNSKIGNAESELATIETKASAVNEVINYLSIVKNFSDEWKASRNYDKREDIANVKARIAYLLKESGPYLRALSIMEAVATPSANGINFESEGQKFSIPLEVLNKMDGEMTANGGGRAAVVAAGIKDVDVRLRNANTALSRADEKAVQEQLAALEASLTIIYGFVKKAYDAYAEEKKRLGNRSQILRLTNVHAELRRVDNQLSELDKQTAELQRKAYDSVNSYGAWVPSLAVRVCCVILAIFLTQFFMSIYRYNTMIATHYYSRADVLRMTCTQGQIEPVNADAFVKLAAAMTIEKIDFILPDNAIKSFLEAAKINSP